MEESQHTYQSSKVGVRHWLMFLAFVGSMLKYCTRVGLSVAMVAMVNQPTSSAGNISLEFFSSEDICPSPNRSALESALKPRYSEHRFDWSSETQGLLHGAFYYGYLISQIPGGWVAHRTGAKLPIALGMFAIGIFSLLSPLAANGGIAAFFTVRLLIGIGQGVIFPSVTVLWREWAPPSERGRLLSVTYSGCQLGTVVGMSVSGLLAQAFGWKSIFYCFGTLSCLWVIPWLLFAHNSPKKHPGISVEEREYIATSLSEQFNTNKPGDHEDDSEVPWLSIFKTPPFYAILLVEFGHSWGFYTLLTNLPNYLNTVLRFSLKSNGALSALPYLLRWVFTLLTVTLADYVRSKDIWSPTLIRKFFAAIAFLGAAGGLIGVVFAGCNSIMALVLFTVAVGLSGSVYAGHLINYAEMSPRYSGILIGIGNTVGTLAGILAPFMVGTTTAGPSGNTVKNWQIVFSISAGFYLAIAVVYVLFGSSKRQKWDQSKIVT